MGVKIKTRKFVASDSSSEEYDLVSGACSIEFYYACQDPFRVAPGNKIVMLWPYDQRPGTPAAKDIVEATTASYEKILQDAGINLRRVLVQGLIRKDVLGEFRQTMIIETTDLNPGPHWHMAATQIQQLLERTTRDMATDTYVRVEIRNPFEMFRDVSSAVRYGTPAHRALQSVEQVMEDQVTAWGGGDATSISYHMRGPKGQEDNLKPTIVVSFKPGSRSIWATIQDKIMKAVEPVGESHGIELYLEFVPGRFMLLNDMMPAKPAVFWSVPEFPSHGSSIGPRGARDAGSLGTFIYFHTPDKKQLKAFLTCYHVVASGDPLHREDNDNNGIGLEARKIETPIWVDYPAAFDAQVTIPDLQLEIARGQDRFGYMAKSLHVIQKNIAAGGIGQVLYGSGYNRRSPSGDRLDWAIVVLEDENLFAKNRPTPRLLNQTESWDGQVKWIVSPLDSISEVGTLGGGKGFEHNWICKTGRTTGFTSGELNSLSQVIYWSNGTTTHEIVLNNAISGESLALPGDSGSMVLNSKREWVGMIIGKDNDAAVMISAQTIMADIQASTGGFITLP